MKLATIRAVLLVCVFCLHHGPGNASLKDGVETGTSRFAALVLIRRDTYGVPHILAKTEEAAAFGLGYAQAEDHFVVIARRLVAARGEMAKYLGQGVESDFLMKRFDNLEVCRTNFRQMDPLLQKIFNAYAAGLNHYVAKHRHNYGWIPVFDGIDVLANGRAGAVNSAVSAEPSAR
jgi:acyl-homoserine lactone acylase PvdQ